MMQHLLTDLDMSKKETENVIDFAIKIKSSPLKYKKSLEGKTLVMLFEKPSTRTRLSFETAMTQLGGHAIYMDFINSQITRRRNIN